MLDHCKRKWPIIFLLFFLIIFFRKLIFLGLLPIQADLLVSWFFPFSSGDFPGYSAWTTHKGLVADDAIRQQFPWKVFAADQWRTGKIPLWNPYAFSGYPQAANLQTGAFYPLNVLFVILDPKVAWTILIILQPFLSFLFMYFFLRTLKLSPSASVFGSLIFVGMTFELLWLEQITIGQTTLWLPLVLTAIQKLFEGQRKWWMIGVFALTMSILAGYAQTTLYVFLVAGFFLTFKLTTGEPLRSVPALATVQTSLRSSLGGHAPRGSLNDILPARGRAGPSTGGTDDFPLPASSPPMERWGIRGRVNRSTFFLGLIMLIFPILLSAIQLLPTLEIYRFSAREGLASHELFSKFLATPRHFLTLFSPDFFGNVATENFWGDQYQDFNLWFGIVALLIIATGLYHLVRIKNIPTTVKWFSGLSLAALFLAFSTPFGYLPLKLNIPVLSTGVPARFLFIFQFSVCILTAYSLECLFKNRFKFSLKPSFVILFLLVLLNLVFLWLWQTSGEDAVRVKNYYTTIRNLGFSTIIAFLGCLALKTFKKQPRLGVSFLLFLASLEYLYLANKYLPFSRQEYLFPSHPLITFLKDQKGIERFWGEGTAYMGTNLPTYYRLYYPEGYDSLYPRRYAELVSYAKNGEMSKAIPRSDVNIDQKSVYKEKMLDLLGVKYLLDKNDLPKSDWEPEDWKFSPSRYKLIWQKGRFKVYENLKALPRVYFAQELISREKGLEILTEIFKNQHQPKLAVIEENLSEDLTKGQAGEVKVVDYSPNRIILQTTNNDSGFLALSDNYFPGWKAYIDGRETKIYRTNYSFRGIVVPNGQHEIKFSYEPWSFRFGAFVSTISLLALIVSFSRLKIMKD